MTGRADEARQEYLCIDLDGLSRSDQQDAMLGLCLAQHSVGDHEAAKQAAESVVKLNGKSMSAHHARIQLAQMKPYSAARTAELLELRNKAASRKWASLENNIRIFLANREDRQEQKASLRHVIDTSYKTKDFYNRFRAILNLFGSRSPGEAVLYSDRVSLLAAYHFFHNERMNDQFDRVHSILWGLFEEEADLGNLLSLFRHSSFIWRLSGNYGKEKAYLTKLKKKAEQIRKSNLPNIKRDRVYFFARVTVVVVS